MRNPPGVKLTLFIDYRSQPARAIMGLCQLNGIEHERKEVLMWKGEHMKEPFITVNPAKQIPAMQEIDERTGQTLTLSESHAILRYLVRSRGLADHWYPQHDLR